MAGDANIAVQFVLNYEEGGESCILDGDPASECLLSEIVGAQPWAGTAQPQYGVDLRIRRPRGLLALWRMFTSRGVTLTVYGVTLAMARNLEAVAAMKEAAGRSPATACAGLEYKDVPEDIERQHIREVVRLAHELTGERPLGNLSGKPSANTLKLVLEEGGFLYSCDSYAGRASLLGPRTDAGQSASHHSLYRSTPTTCVSRPIRVSTPATSSSPISRTRSTCSMRRARKAARK